jgi:dTDP-4-dehydrorhamnose 3,5-epimerase
MKFHDVGLEGARLVELSPFADSRGRFSRLFCGKVFAEAGLEGNFVQINESFNISPGTLRGMHFQLPPAAEVKVVRCMQGKMWDCIIDLRPSSATFRKWFGAELTPENNLMMYVPRGFAHGFITIEPNTFAIYLASSAYAPGSERGVRYNDPAFAIEWPLAPAVISDKDGNWADFKEELVQPLVQV